MPEKSLRGFAAMDREKQRAIASKGGKAAHAKGTAHEFTPDEARAAGRKGGQAAHAKGTAHEFTPEEARAAGRKGGQSSHGGRNAPNQGDGQAHGGVNGSQGMNQPGMNTGFASQQPECQPCQPVGATTANTPGQPQGNRTQEGAAQSPMPAL